MGATEEWDSATPVSEWDSAVPFKEAPAFDAGKGGGFDEIELAPTVKPVVNAGKYSAKNPDGSYANPVYNPASPEETTKKIQTLGAFRETAAHPIDTVTNPSRRRELERGVSDVVTLGAAEKLANYLDKDYAATAEGDAAAAPGFRSEGDLLATPLPSIHGHVLGKVIGSGARGVAKLAAGAEKREIGRAAEKVVEGSRGNARKALTGDDKALHTALAEEPELLAAANSKEPEKVLAAADNLHKKGSDELKQIYRDSNVNRPPPDKAVASNIIAQAEDAELRAVHLERELEGMPQGSEAFKKGKTTLDVLRGEANSLRRDAHRHITAMRAPGVDPKSATTNMDVRIAELESGNVTDREVATKLKKIRDEFHENVGSKDLVPAEKLRSEQTAYQDTAYSKNPLKDPNLTTSIAAADEAQRAVGDVVVKHVTGLDYKAAKELALAKPDSLAGKLFKANQRVNVANRIKASIKSKQGGNPGAPHGIRSIADKVMHTGAAMGAVTAHMTGHSKVAAAIAGIEAGRAAAPYAESGIDKAAIALAKLNNKPASDTIKKYAEKMISLGVATEGVDKAVAKLNKEAEPTE